MYERYIGEIALAVQSIDPAISAEDVRDNLLKTAARLTVLADQEFDEEGKPIKPSGRKKPDDDFGDDTIIVDRGDDDPSSGSAARNADDDLPPAPSRRRSPSGKKRVRKKSTRGGASGRSKASEMLF